MGTFKYYISLLFAIIYLDCLSQTKISIYFDFGKSKLSQLQERRLQTVCSKTDFSKLDSVYYIGVADSVGDIKANMKLSEKRALEIATYCKDKIPKNTYTKISALGEGGSKYDSINRRVDMILFFNKTRKDSALPAVTAIITKAKKCFQIDYPLLNRAWTKTINLKNIEYIQVETHTRNLKKGQTYYSGSMDSNGKFIYTKIVWQKRRPVPPNQEAVSKATILKLDYDRFKIFTIDKAPCKGCVEDFFFNKKATYIDSCYLVDEVIMSFLQYISPPNNNVAFISLRIPQEYIKKDANYYIIGDTNNQLVWTTTTGSDGKSYYNTQISSSVCSRPLIVRKVGYCPEKPLPACASFASICCMGIRTPPRNFGVEIGNYHQSSTNKLYAAISETYLGRLFNTSLLIGVSLEKELYTAARFQRVLYTLPRKGFRQANNWVPIRSLGFPAIKDYFTGCIYMGTEVKALIRKSESNIIDQNIHIGVLLGKRSAIETMNGIGINYSWGINYLDIKALHPYSMFHVYYRKKLY